MTFAALLVALSLFATPTLASTSHRSNPHHSSTPSRLESDLATTSKTFNPRIPLFQRGSYFARLRQNDGVVDLSSLKSQIDVARNKMETGAYKFFRRKHRHLEGFKISSTTEHFLDSVWARVSNSNDDRHLNLKEKRQSNPLKNYDDGSLWAGSISVGTPPQDVTVCFDTGSADFWVADSTVTDAGLETYNVNASSTAKPTDDRFGILYGDGSTVNGPLYQDTVSVAGLKAENAYVAAATTVSKQFYGGDIDGILGMAYPAISNSGEKTIFQSLHEQGLVKGNLFSFQLGDNEEGELYLGGTDSSRFEGEINYTPVTQPAYWTIQGSIGVDGEISNSDRSMIIDTGTTLVIAPPAEAELIYKNVPTATKWKDSFYIYDCSVEWTAQFTFNGQSYTIPSKYLNLGLTEAGSKMCVSGIASQNMGLGNTWLVGGVFLRTVYSVYNLETNSVGFAPLKGKKYEPSSPSSLNSTSSVVSSMASASSMVSSTIPASSSALSSSLSTAKSSSASSTPSSSIPSSATVTSAVSSTSAVPKSRTTKSSSRSPRPRGPTRSTGSLPAGIPTTTTSGSLLASILP